ncbi:uncharacterized protein LOC143276493 [Babylonia areolata]|uniref:uncharacterized protein LOC143276493 n=1 Tax=Babylonia areolata TaxID=304850 RepID=UPI003FD202C8
MTSLQFFKATEPSASEPPEWGTGKPKEPVDVAVPRNATWRYSGEPVTQYYGLTQLKLSNIRSNDELVPRPQAIQIGKDFINKSFPAEHPYSSHIPRFAVIPKFDSPEDPKRGVAARSEQPISSEMPATPFDTIVKEKTKGFPYRHEFQDLPKESEKKALYWPGEDFFDQKVKVLGGKQQFYPIPPKTMCPNLQDRDEDMKVGPRTANTLRNVERQQWMTSHQLDYTGLGPSNPVALDNLEEKRNKYVMTAREDDKLYPHTQNTFDPPRGMEGRLTRKITASPANQKPLESGSSDNPDYRRKMTLTEREEHRLLNGTEYVSLPDTSSDPNRDTRWRDLDTTARAGPSLEKVEELKKKAEGEETETPFPQAGTPPPPEESYLSKLKAQRDMNVQEIEAQNRWKVLELQSPSHDQTAVNKKMDVLFDKEQPDTFYRHEGRYNEERAGLYKTSYDPHRLAWSMNSSTGAPSELMNTLHSHNQMTSDLSLPASRLTENTNSALKWSRTFSLSQPDLSGDRREAQEVLATYNKVKAGQRATLQPPGPHQASPSVQERELLQREATTMGDSYNAKKFLQERSLDRHARAEPLSLMSHDNQSLGRVRSRSSTRPGKNVQFNHSVTVATMSPTSTPPVNVQTQPLNGGEDTPREKVNPTQYTSTHALYRHENNGTDAAISSALVRHSMPAMFDTTARSVHFASDKAVNGSADFAALDLTRSNTFPRRPRSTHGSHGVLDSEYTDQFTSLSTNFMPTGIRSASVSSSYQNQFPIFDLGYKHDQRFDWHPGSGVPRPQTSLLKMQDSFIKSDIRRKFHDLFPETNPELRFNIVKGKKHSFGGFNAQVIHG